MLPFLVLGVWLASQDKTAFDSIVPAGAHPTFVAGGFKFLEGPVWMPEGRLIFSDILGDAIYELKDGTANPIIKPSQRAIGNAADGQGRVISCCQETRSLVRREKDGKLTTLADRFEGKRLNCPDDVVVRSDGTIYFTDPGFAIKAADRELPFSGVYKLSPDGKLEAVVKDLTRPNGLAFSPDEKRLYVNDTIRRQILVFDVQPSGELSHGRFFAVLAGDMPGQANGMKVDAKGNVYCTGPGGILIFTPEAKFIGLIYIREVVSNFCFGGADRKTLYMTAGQSLFKLGLRVEGARLR